MLSRKRFGGLCAKRGLAMLVFGLGPACSVDSLSDLNAGSTENRCESSSECGSGATCNASAGICTAREGALTRVLVEVVPPADATLVGGVRYLTRLDLAATGGGHDIEIDHLATVLGQIDHRSLEEECLADGVALDVSLTPHEHVLGLPGTTYVAAAVTDEDRTHSTFDLEVPPGSYDIYVQPAASSEDCSLAPRLFRDQFLGTPEDSSEGAENVEFALALSDPATLSLSIEWGDAENSLEGWTVVVLDQDSGHLLSTTATLTAPSAEGLPLLYQAEVDYSSARGKEDASAGLEFIRLAPPEGVVAPSVFVQRGALQLFPEETLRITEFSRLPDVVQVGGQVVTADTESGADAKTGEVLRPVGATVSIVSSAIEPTGLASSYVTTLETDSQGRFQVKLPRGTYRVVAAPDEGSGLGAETVTWTLGMSPEVQLGRAIEVRPLAKVHGTLVAARGEPITGFPVRLSASPTALKTSVLDRARGLSPFVPRALTEGYSEQGHFEVNTDYGVFDLSVRPSPASGYGWFVKAGITVNEPEPPVGELRSLFPVRYWGIVASQDVAGSVADALIRAYVYLDQDGQLTDDPGLARSVIQVAETRAGPDGTFELLMPQRLEASGE